MNIELALDFAHHLSPENFFFGAANAPSLSEGGYNYPDRLKNSYAAPGSAAHERKARGWRAAPDRSGDSDEEAARC